MSQIITFSADKIFANDLESIIKKSGYQNRSRFIRDASLYFSEIQQRGELNNMKVTCNIIIQRNLVQGR